MKWYGLKSLISKNYALNALKKKQNSNSKRYLKWQPAKININPVNLLFYIPKS
jgi:hypothetical protein